MAKMWVKKAVTSRTIRVSVQNSASTTGGMLTGLAFNSAGLVCKWIRSDQTSVNTLALVTKTLGTWVSGGFVQLDATNAPGVYDLDLPDAAFVSGTTVQVMLFGAANMVPVYVELELVAVDHQDVQRFGLNVLPATGVLLVKPAVTLASGDVTGLISVNAQQIGGQTPTPFGLSELGTQLQTSMNDQGYSSARSLKLDFLTQPDTTPGTLADSAIKTATFQNGATLPRVTLTDTTTNLTNGGGGGGDGDIKSVNGVTFEGSAVPSVVQDKTGFVLLDGSLTLEKYNSGFKIGTIAASPAPTTTSFALVAEDGIPAVANFFRGQGILAIDGPNAGKSIYNIGYSSGRVFTFDPANPWSFSPVAGNKVAILGASRAPTS